MAKSIKLPDGSQKSGERSTDKGLNGMFRPLAIFLVGALFTVYGFLGRYVWGNVESHTKQISIIESRLAGLEEKVSNIDENVDDVKAGVNKLIDLQLRRNGGT